MSSSAPSGIIYGGENTEDILMIRVLIVIYIVIPLLSISAGPDIDIFPQEIRRQHHSRGNIGCNPRESKTGGKEAEQQAAEHQQAKGEVYRRGCVHEPSNHSCEQ